METERDMITALHQRYMYIRPGTISDRWVRADHVTDTLGTGGYVRRSRICDFMALDRYPGVPYGSKLAVHGHEVKVNRADWLKELREPEKAEAFTPYVHYWWLVVSDKNIVRPDELPDGWGLMAPTKKGALRAVIPASQRTPEPIPLDMSISLAQAAARTAHRAPLHYDAPHTNLFRNGRSFAACGFCGGESPCASHQPREHALHVVG